MKPKFYAKTVIQIMPLLNLSKLFILLLTLSTFTANAQDWNQIMKSVASDRSGTVSPAARSQGGKFGESVSVSGDIAVVGITYDSKDQNGNSGINSGSAAIFQKVNGTWEFVKKLVAPDRAQLDHFGFSVSISGSTVVVGAYIESEDASGGNTLYSAGSAYIFEQDQGGTDNWGQVKKLVASDRAANDSFGYSVSISGSTVVVGAYQDGEDGSGGNSLTYAGSVYIFEQDQGGSGNWGELKKLVASDRAVADLFGYSVSISGSRLVVGAYWKAEDDSGGNSLTYAGSAYIFEQDQGGTGNWGEVKKLVASDRAEYDGFGVSVSISGSTVVVGANSESEDASGGNTLSQAGSAYIFEQDQGGTGNWGEIKKLVASDREAFDNFGFSVSISGSTVVVGAEGEDQDASGGNTLSRAGSAYIFEQDQGGTDNWGEVKKLVASDRAESDGFGCSVSISGSTLVVGAEGESEDTSGGYTVSGAGSAYIFEEDLGGAGNWSQLEKIVHLDYEVGLSYGYSVAVDGDYAVIGAPGILDGSSNFHGSAYILQRNGNTWAEIKKLVASDRVASDFFGFSVSISGTTVVVGAYREDEDAIGGNTLTDAGSAYIFEQDYGGAGNWGEVKKLEASDRTASDYFGYSVSISGSTVVVGAYQEDEDAIGGNTLTSAGSAYIFVQDQGGAGNWGEMKKLVATDRAALDNFGFSVSISGSTVVVGARLEDQDAIGGNPLSSAGSAYIFEQDQGGAANWGEVKKLVASDRAASDYFGYSVSISGSTVVVGAWTEDEDAIGGNPISAAGSAYIFGQDQGGAGNWGELKKLVASDRAVSDYFGSSVSISGSTVVVGAYSEAEDASGGNTLTDAGSAYIFGQNQGGTGNWGEMKKLVASDRAAGDFFGHSVSISGSTVVAGSYKETEDASGGNTLTNAGSAYIFGSSPVSAPEINLKGNSVDIVSSDDTPATADDTDFGSQNISSGTIVKTFTIENTGTAALALTNTSPNYVTISGTNAADFEVSTQPTTPVAATTGSTTFQITFDPSALGSRTATVSIANDDADENPYTFDIAGVGLCDLGSLPTALISGTDNLTCAVTSVSRTASGGNSYSWSGPSAYSAATAAATITSAGTYSVTVTAANSCTATATTVVTLNNTPPSPSVAGTNNLTCSVTSVSRTASGGNSYSWSGPSAYSAATAAATITSAGTYSVIVTAANGCTATATTVVTLNNTPPSPSVAGTNNLTCSVTSVSRTASGGNSYSWSGPSAYSAATAAATITTAGTYSVTVTGANGCTATATTVVSQDIQAPTASIAGTANLTCSVSSVSRTASGGDSYSWSGPSAYSAATAAATITTAGTYSVTVTGANGCTATATTVVSQDIQAPTASIAGTDNLTCAVTSVSRTASGGNSYSWSGPSAYSAATAAATITTAGTYSVTVTGTNGCTATATTVVSQDIQAPTASIAGTANLTCSVSSVSRTASGGNSYSWSDPSAYSAATAAATITTAGTYSVTVTGTNGCTATATTVVSQDIQAPTASIAGTANLTCSVSSVSRTASGGDSYSWSGPSAYSAATAAATITTAGTYSVTVTGTNGCTATATTVVSQNIQAPTPSIAGTANLTCSVSSVSRTASGGDSYSWSGPSAYSAVTAAATITSSGTYSVTVTGANGCTATASTEVLELIPIASIDSQNNVLCKGGNIGMVTIEASSGKSPYTYQLNGGTSQSDSIFSGLRAAAYTVTVTDANGCMDDVLVTITEPDELMGSIDTLSNVLCHGGNTGAVTVIGTGGTGAYTYQLNGGISPSFNGLVADDYTITITDANGCTVNVPVTISEPGALSASITKKENVLCHGASTGSVSLVGLGGTSPYTYKLDGGLSQNNGLFENLSAGNYVISIIDSNSCIKDTTISISEPLALSGSIDSQTNILGCHGDSTGALTITVNGGSEPYMYQLGQGGSQSSAVFTELKAGKDTVTITDNNGCMIKVALEITEPAAINFVLNDPAVVCSPATVDLTAAAITSGSDVGLTYSYFTDAGGNSSVSTPSAIAASGTYYITAVNGNSCSSDTLPINVMVNSPDAVTLPPVMVCGSYSFLDSTYSESTTIVKTLLNEVGCDSVLTLVLTIKAKPETPEISASTTDICLGGSVLLSMDNNYNSLGNDSINWTGGTKGESIWVTPIVSSDYRVAVTSENGCTSDSSSIISITVHPIPAVPLITADNDALCKGENVILFGLCETGTVFHWKTPPSASSNEVYQLSNSHQRTIDKPDTYTGFCESAFGCLSDEVSIIINEKVNCGSGIFIEISPEEPHLCPGESVTLTATGCSGTLTWSDRANTKTGNTVSYTPTVSTTYLVSCSNGAFTSVDVKVAETNFTMDRNISTGVEKYKAVERLQSDKKVGNAAFTPAPNVTYEAGKSIVLNPGFETASHTIFKAEIKTCP